MRLYGREEELAALRSMKERSLAESTCTAVIGGCGVGKTTLVLESIRGTRFVYLLVSRLDPRLLCERMQRAAADAGIDIPGRFETVGDLLKALMMQSESEPLTVIIDDFQEIPFADPSILGQISKVWKEFRERSRVDLIAIESAHSKDASIFEDGDSPASGLPAMKIRLEPFTIAEMKAILRERNPGATPEDDLMMFMLTGGSPRYAAPLMDFGAASADRMLEAAQSPGSAFLKDGRNLLATELGKKCGVHFSILQLISQGQKRRPEIEEALGIHAGAYLERLERTHGPIRQEFPIHEGAGSRNARWTVPDMYLRFYFGFVQPHLDYVELGRSDLHLDAVRAGMPEYRDRALADYFRQRISEESETARIGGLWNRNGSDDIIAVIDDGRKTAELIEVKRNRTDLDLDRLKAKCKAAAAMLDGYDVSYLGLSMDDV